MTFHRSTALRPTPHRAQPTGGWRARLAAAIVVVAAGVAPAVASGLPASGDLDAARQAADRAFDASRYTEALASYEALARRGDAGAARRAGEILLYGQGLMPSGHPCAALRAARWLAAAAAAGDADAGLLWAQAAGLPQSDAGEDAGTRLGRR
jgi:TPR repeat protein